MLCESKLQACSPFALYLLSFEITLNVMLDVRWEVAAFLNFTQSVMCPLRNRRNLNIKARRESFQSDCWLLLELLQERVDECTGNVPSSGPALFFRFVFWTFPTLLSVHRTGLQTPGHDTSRAVNDEINFLLQLPLHWTI